MRYRPTLIKSAILNLLLVEDDLVPALWQGVMKALKKEVPMATFYEAIYRLRDEGLVRYHSSQLTNEKMSALLSELKEGSTVYNEEEEQRGLVILTAKGRMFAELSSLREMIQPSRVRDAERRISSLQGMLSELSLNGA
jgi:Fe2+ or Zn2+ uptake regulation protein